MRQPLLCSLVVEFPAKVVLAGYLVLLLDILARQIGFDGLTLSVSSITK